MSKEIPILFSTPMVQAILEGRKIMTRRIVKFPKDYDGKAVFNNGHFGLKYSSNEFNGCVHRLGPKWDAGDIIWVRESWKANEIPIGWPYHYKALNDTFTHPENEKWKPSIHMPKAACRIWLEVTDVRVERLQDITEEDAKAEGAEKAYDVYPEMARYKLGFCRLWQSINGPESWDANPWVWVISFKHIKHGNVPIGSNAGPCVNPNIPVKRRD